MSDPLEAALRPMSQEEEARIIVTLHGKERVGQAIVQLITDYEQENAALLAALEKATFAIETMVMMRGIEQLIPTLDYCKSTLAQVKGE